MKAKTCEIYVTTPCVCWVKSAVCLLGDFLVLSIPKIFLPFVLIFDGAKISMNS